MMKLYRNDRGGDFLARLSGGGVLKGAAGEALSDLPWSRQDIASRAPLALKNRLAIIGAGWIGRHRGGATGSEQLLALYLPGEICGYGVLMSDPPDTMLMALTPATLWTLPLEDFLTVSEKHTEVISAVLSALARERAISDEHLISIGSRNALMRMAHLICEIQWRFAASGSALDGIIEFPLSQTRLADYLGLSSVHVNRTLQALRREGLIETQARRLRVLDQQKLADIGGFTPTYLELPSAPASSALP
jgi:CRP-like cAMP-binding protein